MIEDRTILCIASNWHYDPTSKHHLMRLLSQRNHVVWVNYHASRRPSATVTDARAAMGRLREIIDGPKRTGPNFTVVTPLVVPLPGSRAAASLNQRLLTMQIENVLQGLPSRPVQLWTFAPDADFLCGQFNEEAVVYYCVDEFSAFRGYDRAAILKAEARLAARADLLVVTSQQLLESKRMLHPAVTLVSHGVDVEHFSRAAMSDLPIPVDVAHLPRPVLGFWGLIQDWLDVELLAHLARSRPEWSLALIGEAACDLTPISRFSNVHLLGRRPYEQLPAYARAFDLGMIPFRVNELTRSVNPIKMREYLAAGLPVVSTDLPEARGYAPHVAAAHDAAEFVRLCEQMLTTDTPVMRTNRRAAMLNESWDAKLKILSACVMQAAKRGRSPASVRTMQPGQFRLPC